MQVSVRVEAGAKKEVVEVAGKGRLKISVKQKPQLGAANKRVVELAAKHFKVPIKSVHILRGHKTPSKILNISGQ